jgi:hypothetical protein
MYRIEDEYGVVLFTETCLRYKGIDVFVLLPNEQHRRSVGRVNYETETLYINRNTNEVLKNYNAYGINFHLLNTAKKFDKVVLFENDTGKIYRAQNKFILSEGRFLLPNQQGLKKQIFITQEWLSHYEITREDAKIILRSEYRID